MIIESKMINGEVQPKYETHLECANCGMQVDAVEYQNGTCTDCGSPWQEKRHLAVHVTSVPLQGKTF
jgi:rRNA maturation endonuclease Nob1